MESRSMKPRGIVFVSCGQRTVEERALGSKICELIKAAVASTDAWRDGKPR
jgi:hypothetical protein